MNVWMRGRAASLTAFQARVDVGHVGARQAGDHRTLDLARDRLHGLEVARRGDREAGLDHVDAEPRELLGDLELLLRVQRDARRLLAVAQRRVEDQYSVGVFRLGHVTPLCLSILASSRCWFAATCGRRRAIPPEGGGEEVEGRGGVPSELKCTRGPQSGGRGRGALGIAPLHAPTRPLPELAHQDVLR